MENSNIVSEIRRKGPEHLRRERYLRDKENCGLAAAELLADKVDVDAGLSAAGNTEQERGAGFSRACKLR